VLVTKDGYEIMTQSAGTPPPPPTASDWSRSGAT